MGIVRRIRRWVVGLVVALVAFSIAWVAMLRWVPVYVTPLMLIRCYQQASRGESLRLHHQWVPLGDISPYLIEAVMCTEDANYLHHHGFDLKEISNALTERERGGRRRGASTISQQTAKNVFLWPESSWLRKALEAYYTLLIELLWGKARIMEVYLNSIEMGEGIYGAEAVARLNFGTQAKGLSRQQCALVAISLPNPLQRDSAHPSPYMLRRQAKVVNEMRWAERTGGLGDMSVFGKP